MTYAVFATGPLDELLAYRDFMGRTTPWYSTAGSGDAVKTRDGGDLRDGRHVYLTYDNKWRGVEPTLQLLDLTPFGRQETWETAPAGTPQARAGSWWRRDGRPVAQWTRTADRVART